MTSPLTRSTRDAALSAASLAAVLRGVMIRELQRDCHQTNLKHEAEKPMNHQELHRKALPAARYTEEDRQRFFGRCLVKLRRYSAVASVRKKVKPAVQYRGLRNNGKVHGGITPRGNGEELCVPCLIGDTSQTEQNGASGRGGPMLAAQLKARATTRGRIECQSFILRAWEACFRALACSVELP